MARLRAAGRPVHGLIVGGPEPRRQAYADALRENVRSRGLAGIVLFTGHRADMRDIYAVSTLVLSLSAKPESFGRTVLEALSLGRPVVGYAHGGVGEILDRLYPAGPGSARAMWRRCSRGWPACWMLRYRFQQNRHFPCGGC
ncbi:MAG: glycosyltransferase family 4 protein [Candidatus Competibacteraceae bacterium]